MSNNRLNTFFDPKDPKYTDKTSSSTDSSISPAEESVPDLIQVDLESSPVVIKPDGAEDAEGAEGVEGTSGTNNDPGTPLLRGNNFVTRIINKSHAYVLEFIKKF